jgi:hypothetical protein
MKTSDCSSDGSVRQRTILGESLPWGGVLGSSGFYSPTIAAFQMMPK